MTPDNTREALQALARDLRGRNWDIRTPQEMADMIAECIDAALAQPAAIEPERASGCVHELKTDPIPFDDVAAGRKTFEIRKNDRPLGFGPGDQLRLRRTLHTGAEMAAGRAPLIYTGETLTRTIAHVLVGPLYGLAADWCILSLASPAASPVAQAAESEVAEAVAWLKSDEVNAGPRTLKAIETVLAALAQKAKPEVAPEAFKSVLLVLTTARGANDWHPNMLKDFDFAIDAVRLALAAPPHPEQSQEGGVQP